MKLKNKITAFLAVIMTICFLTLPVVAEDTDDVKDWSVSKNDSTYVLRIKIRHNNQWDFDGIGKNAITIHYADPSVSADQAHSRIQFTWDGSEVKDGNYGNIEGASILSNEEEKDTLTYTVTIPASFFISDNFSVSFHGETKDVVIPEADKTSSPEPTQQPEETPVPSETPLETSTPTDTPSETEQPATATPDETAEPVSTTDPAQQPVTEAPVQTPEPVTSGKIVIDGSFSDWTDDKMSSLPEPDAENYVKSASMLIQDGKLYLYIQGDGNGSETNAGTHHNGKYSITTDNGRTLLLQLNRDGTVSGGTAGMEYQHSGSQWEISIPLSELPSYQKQISFGLYLMNPGITVTDESHEPSSPVPFEIDGSYGDWKDYPHHEIEYATGGTQASVVDSEGAIYYDASSRKILGHTETNMPAHLNARGYDLTSGVSISLNEAKWTDKTLNARMVTVDENGNINWNSQHQNLPDGTYEFYLFDTSAWGQSSNINALIPQDICYGRAMLTVQNGREEIEWEVDAEKLAAKYNIQPSEIRTASAQFSRLGQQWITDGGASTGIGGSISIACLSMLAVPFFSKRRRNALKLIR